MASTARRAVHDGMATAAVTMMDRNKLNWHRFSNAVNTSDYM